MTSRRGLLKKGMVAAGSMLAAACDSESADTPPGAGKNASAQSGLPSARQQGQGAMILDSHVYCFEPVDRPAGHSSGEEHLKWVQAAHAGHHQPAWRIRDRAPASSRALDPQGRFDLAGLPDVNFRVSREHGRVVWTIDGEDYTKQYFPTNLRNLEFTPHSLIAEMDYAGVDMALLHTDPMLGRSSAYLAECVRLYPDRLRSMAPVDEWRIRTDPDTVIEELEHFQE